MAGWRKIGAGEHRPMPWKNGGGSTAEVAIAPAGASVAGGFDWRLSIATIEQDGPFSAFPGYDRTILLLAGKGMALTVAGQAPHALDRPFVPFPFTGDAATGCRLLDGRCEDLNLMVARERLAATTAIWVPGAAWPEAAPTETLLAFVCRGGLSIRIDEETVPLSARDAVVLEAGSRGAVVDAGKDATVFVARLAPKVP